MNLVPLFEEALEFQNYNGTVLSNGKVAVYYIGRTRLADIYNDVAAEYPAENPRILDNLGMGPVYVSPAFDYEIVVFDEYNNELFSVKKYLHSKGEHSTANVVVTPSENIAVSAWTVGDVQVYMPYLTGQLGKVYTGIEPIVVNNVEDKISAQHVPLGVQDPLYFVQDDEEGCIIGFSGQTVPEGVMVESALGFENNKITGYNGSAFSAGNTYEEGSYISIADNTISVTGLTPVPSDTASTGLVAQVSADIVSQIPSTAGLATTAQLDEKLDKADSANFYPMTSNPSGFLTAHQSLTGYATEQWVEDKGYLTGIDIPESANWNSTYNTVHDNSASWTGGSTPNPQIPVTGINGIKISESGDQVVFEVSGDYYTNDNPSGFITGVDLSDYATTAQLADKQDITGMTAYQPVGNYQTAGDYLTTADSANFYTTANESGFITGVDLTPYQTTAGMTAYQPVGDYLTTGDSANFYTTANESGFITGVDLTPYQTVEGMTAYQPVGDYLTTADSANFYTTANESGFISEVPAGTMNESAFSYDASDNITAYNGSAFKAGDEFPQSATEAIETVTANSADWNGTTETVNINSGVWGGSALPVSAGPGIKLEMVDNTLVASTDETVLYDSSALISNDQVYGTTFNISEPVTNFERFKVYYTRFPWTDQCPSNQIQEFDSTVPVNVIVLYTTFATSTATNPNWYICTETITDISGTTWKLNACIQNQLPNGNSNADWIYLKPYKVVGINRIAGGN